MGSSCTRGPVEGLLHCPEAGGEPCIVDRMREDEGATVALRPILFRDDDDAVMDADGLGKVKVEATVQGHERGPKIHVLKFKPKRGYKKRMGHRSDLTRLQVSQISKQAGSGS